MKLHDEYGLNGRGMTVLLGLGFPVCAFGMWAFVTFAMWATGPSETEMRARHAAWVKLYSRPDITFEEWQRLDTAYLLPGGDVKRAKEAADAAAASAAASAASSGSAPARR